jgi:hypothetical protein
MTASLFRASVIMLLLGAVVGGCAVARVEEAPRDLSSGPRPRSARMVTSSRPSTFPRAAPER